MPKFIVKVRETTLSTYLVEANSPEEAEMAACCCDGVHQGDDETLENDAISVTEVTQ